MEQIQIRQPKMPAAQSFIQILGTFLATLFNFIATHFSYVRKNIFYWRTAKSIGSTEFRLKNLTTFSKGKNCQRGMDLRI